MSYSFRRGIKLPDQLRIEIEADKWVLTPTGAVPEISLRSKSPGTLISKSTDLVFRGNGYVTEADAYSAAEGLRDAVTIAFARLRIGADFGDRAPRGMFTEAGLLELQRHRGHERVLNDVHGLMVFGSEPPPVFVNLRANFIVGKGQEKFIEALRSAHALKHKISEDHRLAFDLFSASFFEPSADARLLMLMMGVETLIKSEPRSKAAQIHVRILMLLTKWSIWLSKTERESLIGSLEWLSSESISQAGRKLAARLGTEKYLNMSAPKFFTHCYKLRSKLAHGHVPRPSREIVDAAAVNLEAFLGDLLSGPLFEKVSLGSTTHIASIKVGG